MPGGKSGKVTVDHASIIPQDPRRLVVRRLQEMVRLAEASLPAETLGMFAWRLAVELDKQAVAAGERSDYAAALEKELGWPEGRHSSRFDRSR